jgi:hypothetical protein
MTQKLILQLIQVAIALAQSQLAPGDAADTFVGIVQRGMAAYQTHTGQPMDPSLIKAEAPL